MSLGAAVAARQSRGLGTGRILSLSPRFCPAPGILGRDRLGEKLKALALLLPRKLPDGWGSFPTRDSQPRSMGYLHPERSGTSFKCCLDKQ